METYRFAEEQKVVLLPRIKKILLDAYGDDRGITVKDLDDQSNTKERDGVIFGDVFIYYEVGDTLISYVYEVAPTYNDFKVFEGFEDLVKLIVETEEVDEMDL